MPESNKSAKPTASSARQRSRLRLAAVAVPVAGLVLLGSTVTSQAFFTPDVVKQIDHFVECFGWMITDPEIHQAKCGPAHPVPNESLGSGGGDGVKREVIVTTTTTTTTTTSTTVTTTGSNGDGNGEGGGIV